MSGAYRFLHTNLNTPDAPAAVTFYEALAGLRMVMKTESPPVDGGLFGMPGVVTDSDAWFCYDDRGGRIALGLELQQWDTPPVEGVTYSDVRVPGMQALGLSVPSLDSAEAAVVAGGGTLVGRRATALHGGGPTGWVRDRDGVLVELVEQPGSATGRLRRLLISCPALTEGLAFYNDLGFREVGRTRHDDATTVLPSAPPSGLDAVELQLVDDPSFSFLVLGWDDAPTSGSYPSANHRGLYRCALAVEDVAAEHARLTAAGWRGIDAPAVAPMTGTPLGQLTVLFTRDPWGVTVELVERPKSAFQRAAASGG